MAAVRELAPGRQLDDVSEGLVEALVRLAPADLHLLITSRAELPFSVERLRGQGQVSDLAGPSLAFS